jgi:hypothetical protein
MFSSPGSPKFALVAPLALREDHFQGNAFPRSHRHPIGNLMKQQNQGIDWRNFSGKPRFPLWFDNFPVPRQADSEIG